MAAVLACGPGAALSHRDAGHLRNLYSHNARIEVTVPATANPRRPGLRVHRTTLRPEHITIIEGIPVTSLTGNPRHPGAHNLRTALATYTEGTITESDYEALLLHVAPPTTCRDRRPTPPSRSRTAPRSARTPCGPPSASSSRSTATTGTPTARPADAITPATPTSRRWASSSCVYWPTISTIARRR